MKIGIIGAGNIGGTLTRRLTSLGHDVSVANSRGPETLADLATETGATAVLASQAAQGADIVVVTVPEKSVPDLPEGLLDAAAADVVVIDTNNYYHNSTTDASRPSRKARPRAAGCPDSSAYPS